MKYGKKERVHYKEKSPKQDMTSAKSLPIDLMRLIPCEFHYTIVSNSRLSKFSEFLFVPEIRNQHLLL